MKKTLVLFLAGVLAMSSIQLSAQNQEGSVNEARPERTQDENVELKSSRDLQTPPAFFNYQAALRDASGLILAEEEVEVVVEILEGGVDGAVVYTQTETVTTTAQGLINLKIGSDAELDAIAWHSNSYFIRLTVEGTEMGVSELLTVPYAMYSDMARYATTAETADNVVWQEDGADLYVIDYDVAVGTDLPDAELEVYRNNTATNSQVWVSQEGEGDATVGIFVHGGQMWSLGIDNSDADKFKISTSNSASAGQEAMTITTDNYVGVGTSEPTANLHVQGGMKVGETGVEIGDIIELTGTTDVSNAWVAIPWPTGYTKDNSRVLSVEVQKYEAVDGFKSLGYTIDGVTGSIYVSLSSSVWLYYPNDDTMKSQNFRITLMRVQ